MLVKKRVQLPKSKSEILSPIFGNNMSPEIYPAHGKVYALIVHKLLLTV